MLLHCKRQTSIQYNIYFQIFPITFIIKQICNNIIEGDNTERDSLKREHLLKALSTNYIGKNWVTDKHHDRTKHINKRTKAKEPEGTGGGERQAQKDKRHTRK